MTLWKVAASGKGAPENVPKTLSSPIGSKQKAKLPTAYKDLEYAWGSQHSQYVILEHTPKGLEPRKENSSQTIMKKGDVCLFYSKDIKKQSSRSAFFWMATIKSEPFYSEEVSSALWDTNGFPVVYELTKPVEIMLTPAELGDIIDPNGESHRYHPLGLTPIKSKLLENNYEANAEDALNLVLEQICNKSGLAISTITGMHIKPMLPNKKEQVKRLTLGTVLSAPKKRKTNNNGSNGQSRRRSSNAKQIGDHCEGLVVDYLKLGHERAIPDQVKNVASKNKGWDIEFTRADGRRILAEVKGTTTSKMENFEITQNEWRAAESHRDDYWCFLVSDCYKESPKLEILKNPAKMQDNDEAELVPTRFSFSQKVK